MDDAFIDAYFAIDKDMSGQITVDELVGYQKQMNFDKSFVTKWRNLFDRKGTGVITLENFCDVLGLEVAQVKKQRQLHSGFPEGQFPEDIEVIQSDMVIDYQLSIIDVVREGLNKCKERKELVKFIKLALDQKFERLWHCVIIQGQYWSYYSHEPQYSFVFKYKPIGIIFVIWRTPGY